MYKNVLEITSAKAIVEIRKFGDPLPQFNKEDLLKDLIIKMVFLDLFLDTQRFNLIEEDKKPDNYLLKGEMNLMNL